MKKEWRCKACSTRLGIRENEQLHLKYKDINYRVKGPGALVTAICRKCGCENHGPTLQLPVHMISQ